MSAKIFDLLTNPIARRRLRRVLRSRVHSVVLAKAGIQKYLCSIDSRFRGNDSPLPTHRLISIHDAAKYIGVSPDTLRNWGKAGKLTPLRTQGGQRRYR